AFIDPRDYRVDPDRLAFFHQNFGQRSRRGRRDLRIHLVRRYFKERLVALHAVARLFQPLRQRSFDNAFAHLGHYDVSHFVRLFLYRLAPVRPRRRPRRSRKLFENAGQTLRPLRLPLRALPAPPSTSPAWSSRTARCTGSTSDPYSR